MYQEPFIKNIEASFCLSIFNSFYLSCDNNLLNASLYTSLSFSCTNDFATTISSFTSLKTILIPCFLSFTFLNCCKFVSFLLPIFSPICPFVSSIRCSAYKTIISWLPSNCFKSFTIPSQNVRNVPFFIISTEYIPINSTL